MKKKIVKFPDITPKNTVVQFPVKKRFCGLPTWKDVPTYETRFVENHCNGYECFGINGGDTVVFRVTDNIEQAENSLILYQVGQSKFLNLGILNQTTDGTLKISGKNLHYFNQSEIRLYGIVEAKIKPV